MKTMTLFAALALGTAMTQQAVACDWGLHADSTNASVVVCDNGACRAVEPTAAQQAAATEPAAPAAPTAPAEPASPAPVTVALH